MADMQMKMEAAGRNIKQMRVGVSKYNMTDHLPV